MAGTSASLRLLLQRFVASVRVNGSLAEILRIDGSVGRSNSVEDEGLAAAYGLGEPNPPRRGVVKGNPIGERTAVEAPLAQAPPGVEAP